MDYKFIDNIGSFELKAANLNKYVYFPLCNEDGMMSSVTPELGGDAKLNQNSFILQPVSVEDLHNNRATRNFWLKFSDGQLRSATGVSVWQAAEGNRTTVRAGLLWHESENSIVCGNNKLKTVITSFVPVKGTVEIMRVRIENEGEEAAAFTPAAVIPLYCRSAVNQRDHRHVTSLLHRIYAKEYGVSVIPTMTFDERGHKKNSLEYYVASQQPVKLYPTVLSAVGECGTWDRPCGLFAEDAVKAESCAAPVAEGVEAVGGLEFAPVSLAAGESCEYVILIGVSDPDNEGSTAKAMLKAYGTPEKCEAGLLEVKKYWQDKVKLRTATGDSDYDNYMLWVGLQPFLRKIMGCSFLPYHDYGKGGRGWRDLWQDCLALLLMEPQSVRADLINNYAGVRPDGTNATIIGTKPGEFIADRNGIVRVWMDHAVWPWKTTKLYIDKTGDYEILHEKQKYFTDRQQMRGRSLANSEEAANNAVPVGTVFEHLLLTHLSVAGDLGEHGHMALRGADWNDALDMASMRGESVAFTAAYAGNILEMAEMAGKLGGEEELNEHIAALLMDISAAGDDTGLRKKAVDTYCGKVLAAGDTAAGTVRVPAVQIAEVLNRLGNSIISHIRSTERMEKDGCVWFNGYYDNQGRKVESLEENRVMLTSGVFTIMSGVATDDELDAMIKTADKYLLRAGKGGYSLNTRFADEPYYAANMGRAYGFAYGQKENGAVFSHMAVMFAYALKKRGRIKEADRVINELIRQSMNFSSSRMYPGVPEYFDLDGRGMYTYLTGAASWMLLYMFE